jgi:hypothetical protein
MNASMHSDPGMPKFGRRDLLKTLSSGFGYLAFASLATHAAQAAAAAQGGVLAPKNPHFPARAKRVIFLCMRGGPSHVDTFDYKPKLRANSGAPGTRPGTKLLGSKWKFAQRGQSGLWVSDLFPKVAQHADDLCVIRSMQTDLPAHPQAFLQLHTGSFQFVRPSLGAWTLYGLGTENENLPGFVTITPSGASGGAQNYGSSFLPAIYQGTRIGVEGRPLAGAEIRNLKSPLAPAVQRAELDLVQRLNRERLRRDVFNPAVEGVIESYELAFRMQREMPQVMDLTGESEATQKLYGLDDEATADFGRKCLLARRLVEAGVRFVEISHGDWDQHTNLTAALGANCHSVDQPIAALLTDLKERGLLKDTLVIWGGEFGRTPHAQGNDGRDHNNKAFSLWMAGGGVKAGYAHGETDDYGYEAVIDPVHIHDLHATILHLLGLDHERLTYRYAGRDFRLTDVHGHVVKQIVS